MPSDEATSWENYNLAQQGRPVRELLITVRDLAGPGEGRLAVDFGCGLGIETQELLTHGWRVYAVDGDAATAERIRITSPGMGAQLEVVTVDFAELQSLPTTDLFYAGLSLPFVPAQHFDRVWSLIRSSLSPGAWLAVHLFGDRDSWAESGEATCFSAHRVRDLLSGLDLHAFDEKEWDGASFGGPKHWHAFTAVGRSPAAVA